jgi:hypothetical protein
MKKRSERELNIVIYLKQPIKRLPGSGGGAALFFRCSRPPSGGPDGSNHGIIEEFLVIHAGQMV